MAKHHNSKTHETFLKEVFDLVGDEYVVLGEYKSYKDKIKFMHNKCNNEYETSPGNFLSGNRCHYCNGGIKRTHEEFIKEVYALVGDHYTVLGKYKNSKEKLIIRHNECNYENNITPTNFLNGGAERANRCPNCSTIKKPTFIQVQKEFKSRGYTLLETEYMNNHTPMRYHCPKHPDKELKMTYNNLRNERKCPYCSFVQRSGIGHPNWKEGVSPLSEYLRNFLTKWKNDSVTHSDNKCIITDEDNWDGIHHLYGFDLILKETIAEVKLDVRKTISMYDKNELNLLIKKCLEIHYRYPLGVCLREDVHRLFHQLYGYGGNTPEQFEEFKLRWKMGEFKDLI